MSYSDEPDVEEESGERLSDDTHSLPRGVQKVNEQGSSEDKEMSKSSVELREKANGEEASETEANKDSNDEESSPREMEKSYAESPDPDNSMNADISDDEPLVRKHSRCNFHPFLCIS